MQFLLALTPIRRLLALGGMAVVLMGVGALGWHLFPLVGPMATIARLRADIEAPTTGYRDRLAAADRYGADREKARKLCEEARSLSLDQDGRNIAATSQRNSKSAVDAFNAGYAAGKALCTKGTPNANAGPTVVRPSGGVSDLSGSFNASAYRPGGPLPR